MRTNQTWWRNPTTALAAVMLLCAVMFIGAGAYKYSYWGHGFDMVDFHMPIQGTLEGRFLAVSRYNFTDTFMGLDVALGFLPAIPFYALMPSAYTLVVLQSLLLVSGAIPVYLIARGRFANPWAGVAWAAAYLIYPTTQFMGMAAPFQPRIPGLIAFLWAFYCLEQRKLTWYWVCLGLAMLTRSDAALVAFAFGLYAGLRRMDWRWSLLPAVVALGYFYAAITYVTPLFYSPGFNPVRVSLPFDLNRDYNNMWPCGVSPQACYYAHLGGSLPEIAKNVLTHPVEVFFFLTQAEKLQYVLLMFAGLLFLPLFAPREVLLCAPIFGINLLSNRIYQYVITEQYQILVIPGIVIAGICGSAWLWQQIQPRLATARQAQGLLAASAALVALIALLNIPLKNPVISAIRYPETPARVAIMERMKAQIPLDAFVAATSFQAPHLIPRAEIFYIPGGKMHHQVDEANYALIDGRASALQGTGILEHLQTDPQWELIDSEDDLFLFRKRV